METERNFANPPPGSALQQEPFRLFFPLGVVLSWVGVGHWAAYAIGVTRTYSCEIHGLVQMQAFMMAFACGFLLTALPRRTSSAPPSRAELGLFAAALVTTTVALQVEVWWAAQLSYAATFVMLIRFAASRFLGSQAGRRPPAAFVLIPLGVAHGLVGATLILAEHVDRLPLWAFGFGQLLVQQGVFLCLVIGVGNLVLPLMGGVPPPPDLGSSPRETCKALLFALAAVAVFFSLLLEQCGWPGLGQALRALVVVFGLGPVALRRPGKPGLHRRLAWLSVWMIPVGLLAAAAFPDFRVATLHVVFIAGFGLMAFAVASHVSFAHLDLENLGEGRPWPVVAVATFFALALLGRVVADSRDTFFEHLGVAAVLWMIGSAAWLSFFGPILLRRATQAENPPPHFARKP